MSQDNPAHPESDGPFTPEQFIELQNHPNAGEIPSEVEADVLWLKNVVNNTHPSDPAYKRFKPNLDAAERYLHLYWRHREHGVATVIDLEERKGD